MLAPSNSLTFCTQGRAEAAILSCCTPIAVTYSKLFSHRGLLIGFPYKLMMQFNEFHFVYWQLIVKMVEAMTLSMSHYNVTQRSSVCVGSRVRDTDKTYRPFLKLQKPFKMQ